MDDPQRLRLTLNNTATTLTAEPRQSLAEVLRDQAKLRSVHIGCAQGHCGTCNILLDGVLVRGCLTLACQADGSTVLTAEGIVDDGAFGGITDALARHRALQCGYCMPGFIVLLAAIVQEQMPAADAHHALSANLCRCTGYVGLMAALDDLIGTPTAPAMAREEA